jgi:hypothetical protein
MTDDDKQHGQEQGIQEGRQGRAQDEVAKRRPGLDDQKLHDAHERRPESSTSRTD